MPETSQNQCIVNGLFKFSNVLITKLSIVHVTSKLDETEQKEFSWISLGRTGPLNVSSLATFSPFSKCLKIFS